MKLIAYLLVALWCALVAPATAQSNRFVHQAGRQVVDGAGKPLQLRGVNLGGWLLWEGWIFGQGFTSQSTITDKLAELIGKDGVSQFRDQIHQQFITDADLKQIAELGFNSVRVPFNCRLLENDAGWQILDALIDNCEKHHLYVILDMHAVPGGQNGLFICDPGSWRESVWASTENQQKTIDLWKRIAERYRDRTIIAAYDLINEPDAGKGESLVDLYRHIIEAVRAVDVEHLIVIEGNKFATDISIFKKPLCDNLCYSFHIYTWFGDDRAKQMAKYRELSVKQNVPVWCGEFGENNYKMIRTTVEMFESPENGFSGWSFWTWKKAPTASPGLATIKLPKSWKPVINWTGAWFPQKPDREQAQTGIDEFLKAAEIENCQLDEKMLAALLPKSDK